MGAHHSVEAGGTSGWLATSPFGCCAPGGHSDEEVDPFQTNRGNGRRRSITSEQPRALRPMLLDSTRSLPRPQAGQSMRQWVGSRQVESRTPGYPHLNMRKPRHRPVISNPTDFRHIDGSGPQQPPAVLRRSQTAPLDSTLPAPTLRRNPSNRFRPLQLSIYMPENRLSPLPDFTRNSWDRKPDSLTFPGQALVRRSRTDSMCSDGDAFVIPRKPIPSYVSGWYGNDAADMPLRPVHRRSSTLPAPQRPSSVNADLCTRERETESPLPLPASPARVRSNTEPRGLRKQRSMRSPRDSVEDAIDELNMIVEERRAKKAASNSPKQHHVPALAPNFKMHVRSETLSDIGSALSVPYTSKPLPSIPPSPVAENDGDSGYGTPTAVRSHSNSQTDLLTRFPTPPDQTGRPRTPNSTKARLAQLMSRRGNKTANNASISSTATATSSTSKLSLHARTATDDTLNSLASSATATSTTPFYQCGPNASSSYSPIGLPSRPNAYQRNSPAPVAMSPSLASTTATCPTNSTISISTFRDAPDSDESDSDDDADADADSDARSSTPDTTVSVVEEMPEPEHAQAPVRPRNSGPYAQGASPRNLSVPSFGVAMELRERQGKSWSAVVEDVDVTGRLSEEEDKRIEHGRVEAVAPPPMYTEVDLQRRGEQRLSSVGMAF